MRLIQHPNNVRFSYPLSVYTADDDCFIDDYHSQLIHEVSLASRASGLVTIRSQK